MTATWDFLSGLTMRKYYACVTILVALVGKCLKRTTAGAVKASVYSNHITSNGVKKFQVSKFYVDFLSDSALPYDFFFCQWSAATRITCVQKKPPPIGGVQPLLHMGKCAEIRRTNIFCGLNLNGPHATINKLTSSLRMPHEQARAELMGEHLDVWKEMLCLLPKYMLRIYYLMMCIDRNRCYLLKNSSLYTAEVYKKVIFSDKYIPTFRSFCHKRFHL